MEKHLKEKKFISLVVYLHNDEEEIIPFFQQILPVVEQRFDQYEIVLVDDACTDGTITRLKEYLEKADSLAMVNIIHMSFYHGVESAMNAGRDLAIGDFIYEFDTPLVDYEPWLLIRVYEKLLEGCDIVAAGQRGNTKLTSRLFYSFYNATRRGNGNIGPETFRIVSRRAVNRVKAMGQYIPYRKAVYANCGLRTAVIEYESKDNHRHKRTGKVGERASLALDSFIYFTNAMERVSLLTSCIFFLISVGMGIYILHDYFIGAAVVEGWMSTMGFLAIGFCGVFGLLTIVLKYLSVLLNLVFRQQRYLVSDIEKVVKE